MGEDLKMYFFKMKPLTPSSEKLTAFYVTVEYESEYACTLEDLIHTLGTIVENLDSSARARG